MMKITDWSGAMSQAWMTLTANVEQKKPDGKVQKDRFPP